MIQPYPLTHLKRRRGEGTDTSRWKNHIKTWDRMVVLVVLVRVSLAATKHHDQKNQVGQERVFSPIPYHYSSSKEVSRRT